MYGVAAHAQTSVIISVVATHRSDHSVPPTDRPGGIYFAENSSKANIYAHTRDCGQSGALYLNTYVAPHFACVASPDIASSQSTDPTNAHAGTTTRVHASCSCAVSISAVLVCDWKPPIRATLCVDHLPRSPPLPPLPLLPLPLPPLPLPLRAPPLVDQLVVRKLLHEHQQPLLSGLKQRTTQCLVRVKSMTPMRS
jgi:hypothetical protein